jgi:cyclopropane fatty-acyl-phospholipid synthase-like methyltransferase
MTGAADAPDDQTRRECRGAFDEIRSWGVLSHYDFSRDECRQYLDNVFAFLKDEGQAIFKLDIDTHKAKKYPASISLEFLEGLIRERFVVVHTDVLAGNTPGHIHYAERR